MDIDNKEDAYLLFAKFVMIYTNQWCDYPNQECNNMIFVYFLVDMQQGYKYIMEMGNEQPDHAIQTSDHQKLLTICLILFTKVESS